MLSCRSSITHFLSLFYFHHFLPSTSTTKIYVTDFSCQGSRGASCRNVWDEKNFRDQYVRTSWSHLHHNHWIQNEKNNFHPSHMMNKFSKVPMRSSGRFDPLDKHKTSTLPQFSSHICSQVVNCKPISFNLFIV